VVTWIMNTSIINKLVILFSGTLLLSFLHRGDFFFSILTTNRKSNMSSTINYNDKEYRSFIFSIHPEHGLLLLHCTRKRKKGDHFQLPGGHVDEPELLAAANSCGGNVKKELEIAGKMGGARELYEETGIDVRKSLDRLIPVLIKDKLDYKSRLFYLLKINDKDFFSKDDLEASDKPSSFSLPMCDDVKHLMVSVKPQV